MCSQNYEKQIFKSDSLMTSVLNRDIFKTNFKLQDINSYAVSYNLEVDGYIYKSISLFFDSKGNLKSNKYILQKHKNLRGFIQIKRFNPKMSFAKQFKIAMKSGLDKIDSFRLSQNNGNIFWFFYEDYMTDDKRNGSSYIKIDDNGNVVGDINSIEEF